MDRAAGWAVDDAEEPSRSGAVAPISVHEAWNLLLALRRRADLADGDGRCATWSYRRSGPEWRAVDAPLSELRIETATGRVREGSRLMSTGARQLLDLHAKHALARRPDGHVVAMLGQSLDGFIATRSGHSRYINGEASLVHLHRIRALSDAVVVGVGTALADSPRLTTRHVAGPHPVRVVLDPHGRLPPGCGLLRDGAAATLVIRATDGARFEQRLSDQAIALHLPALDGRIAPADVRAALADRGLGRLLVEGGGITVARFIEAGVVDRLHLAVAPLILGGGRPALPLPPVERLDKALRPACARHVMGEDMLFDLRLERRADPG